MVLWVLKPAEHKFGNESRFYRSIFTKISILPNYLKIGYIDFFDVRNTNRLIKKFILCIWGSTCRFSRIFQFRPLIFFILVCRSFDGKATYGPSVIHPMNFSFLYLGCSSQKALYPISRSAGEIEIFFLKWTRGPLVIHRMNLSLIQQALKPPRTNFDVFLLWENCVRGR